MSLPRFHLGRRSNRFYLSRKATLYITLKRQIAYKCIGVLTGFRLIVNHICYALI